MSDKKTLLKETQIRRMMKIAGIPALGETFISNYSRFNEEEEELPPEEDPMAVAGEEAPLEDPMAADAEVPVEAPAEGGEVSQEKVEAIVDAVLAGIEQETGVPLERVPDAAAGEEAIPPDVGGEEEVAAAPEEGGEEFVPEEEPVMEAGKYKREDKEEADEDKGKDDDLEEALKAAGIELSADAKTKLVNEVSRRVARRLVRESKRSRRSK